MIYKVEISKQARSDLEGIYEYIAFTLLAPENAKGQIDRLEDKILNLDHMPYRFREYEEEPWRSRGLRIMPVDNYVVLYIPNKDDGTVVVVRVMYSGRNIDQELREHTKS